MSKNIGIIGSGAVAQALAAGFLKHGHPVKLGTRDTGKLKEFVAGPGKGAQVGSFEDAAKFGSVLVLAVKGNAAEKALQLAGLANLKGKTILDATNPIAEAPPVNGVLQYFTGPNESLMERLQKAAPEAHFVKAFSCIGSPFMVNPSFPGGKPTMFICGNNDIAKKEAAEILHQFGFEVDDMGKVEAARAIEPLAQLWCIPGLVHNRWAHAFRLLKL